MNNIEAYPLCWPVAYSRTVDPIKSKFKTTLGKARDYLTSEIGRLKANDLILSTNIPTKQNGELYADWQRYRIDDHGVAVYFTYKGKQVCLCCDKYERIYENVHAIARTIEALRQIDRDGVSDFLDHTFTGFQALPEKSEIFTKSVWEILGLSAQPTSVDIVHSAYKNMAKILHPDKGGSNEAFSELSQAYQQALQYFNK